MKVSLEAPVAASQEVGFSRLHQRLTDNGCLSTAVSSRVDPPRTISYVQQVSKDQQWTITLAIAPSGPGSSTLSMTTDMQSAAGGWLAAKLAKKKFAANLAILVATADGTG